MAYGEFFSSSILIKRFFQSSFYPQEINYSDGAVVTAVAIAFHRAVIIKEAFMQFMHRFRISLLS